MYLHKAKISNLILNELKEKMNTQCVRVGFIDGESFPLKDEDGTKWVATKAKAFVAPKLLMSVLVRFFEEATIHLGFSFQQRKHSQQVK